MATVFIPPLLLPLTLGVSPVVVEGDTVRTLIQRLEQSYPGLAERLSDGQRILPGLSVVVDGQVSPRGLSAVVNQASEVHFLPAIGGG